MEKANYRVLLTGGGAPGTSGTVHMLNKGSESEGVRLELFATDNRSGYATESKFKSSFKVPSPDSPEYLSSLNEIVSEHGIDLLIPQTTKESAVLSAYGNQVSTRIAVLPQQHFELLNDKGALHQKFRDLGLPSAEVRTVGSRDQFLEAIRGLGFPEVDLVVKPLSSSGMRGVRKLSSKLESKKEFLEDKPHSWSISEADIVSILGEGEWPPLLVMPFLDGPEYSVDVLRRSGITIVLPRERTSIRAGISMSTRLDLDDSIVTVIEHFMKEIDIEGLLGFQFIINGGIPYVLESNPRVQGTMVSSLLSGVNLLWIEAKHHLGLPLQPSEFQVVNSSGEFVRTWSGELRFASGKIEVV